MKKYLIAVEIEDGLGKYEVFDYVMLESSYEEGVNRWSLAASQPNYVMECTGMKNLTVGATLSNGEFIPVEGEFDHSTVFTDRIFCVISDNKIYGIIFINIGSEKEIRYEHAIESKVIVVDGTDHPGTNLGDIWDGNKFTKLGDIQDV